MPLTSRPSPALFIALVSLVLAAPVASAAGKAWQGHRVGGTVNAFAALDETLFVCGYFYEIDSIHAAGVAALDENGWRALRGGVPGARSLMPFDGGMVVGGGFHLADGEPASNIAYWKDGWWQPMGPGSSGQVVAVEVYQDSLVIGGGFPAGNGIGVWNGSKWRLLGGPLSSSVFTLIPFGEQLVAGGYFTSTNTGPLHRIAAWSGDAWSEMGGGFDQGVFATTIFEGDLVAGGLLQNSGATPVKRVARWNGQAWVPIGQGFDDAVRSLAVHNGQLFAGGDFEFAGTTRVNHIARWDGSTWNALGTGTDGTVEALFSYGGLLYVGGSFRHADGDTAYDMATWHDPDVAIVPLSFRFRTEDRGFVVAWDVLDDENPPLGFNLYRRSGPVKVRLNASLLAGRSHYEFVDPTRDASATWWLEEIERDGRSVWHGPATKASGDRRPPGLVLSSPNPFHGTLSLVVHGDPGRAAHLDVFDVAGRRVRTLAVGVDGSDERNITWDGRDDAGAEVRPGAYFVRLSGAPESRPVKVIRLP